MFGLDGPSKLTLLRHYRSGDLVVGILHRVEPRKRIGFVVMFPPDPSRDFWEFGYAIGDPLDRDAFSAMSSTDAMAHYMFEHLHVEAMGWRTRSDNHAASAVIRRLGYTPRETRDDKSYQYTILIASIATAGSAGAPSSTAVRPPTPRASATPSSRCRRSRT